MSGKLTKICGLSGGGGEGERGEGKLIMGNRPDII
jgi:hypothetical protein